MEETKTEEKAPELENTGSDVDKGDETETKAE